VPPVHRRERFLGTAVFGGRDRGDPAGAAAPVDGDAPPLPAPGSSSAATPGGRERVNEG
jgi:hypothetical protein